MQEFLSIKTIDAVFSEWRNNIPERGWKDIRSLKVSWLFSISELFINHFDSNTIAFALPQPIIFLH